MLALIEEVREWTGADLDGLEACLSEMEQEPAGELAQQLPLAILASATATGALGRLILSRPGSATEAGRAELFLRARALQHCIERWAGLAATLGSSGSKQKAPITDDPVRLRKPRRARRALSALADSLRGGTHLLSERDALHPLVQRTEALARGLQAMSAPDFIRHASSRERWALRSALGEFLIAFELVSDRLIAPDEPLRLRSEFHASYPRSQISRIFGALADMCQVELAVLLADVPPKGTGTFSPSTPLRRSCRGEGACPRP